MPPCLASPASETSGIAKTHKTATASACTLRMVPLPRIRSETGRFAADDSMTAGLGNPAWPLSLLLLRTRKGARHFVHPAPAAASRKPARHFGTKLGTPKLAVIGRDLRPINPNDKH